MSEYINKSNTIDILDDLWNSAKNNSRDFYLRLRKAIYDLPTEEIIYCKDCKCYCNVLYKDIHYGKCDALGKHFIRDANDFCSCARLKDEDM